MTPLRLWLALCLGIFLAAASCASVHKLNNPNEGKMSDSEGAKLSTWLGEHR